MPHPQPRPSTTSDPDRRAVVIGGGIAGLLAAHVLSQHFPRVTVLERDRLPDHPSPRRGTPQARHMHIVLAAGLDLLERLVPGIQADLAAHGAHTLELTRDVAWRTPAGWFPRIASGLRILSATHPLVEHTLRRRITTANADRMELLDECQVTELLADRDRGAITGVGIDAAGTHQKLPAALVVDAGGRGSPTPRWLAALGYPNPPVETVTSGVAYATRLYAAPPDHAWDWMALNLQRHTSHHHDYGEGAAGGSIFPIEPHPTQGPRWVVTLTGRKHLPASDQEWKALAATLDNPSLVEAIHAAHPLSGIWTFHGTESRWRRYDRIGAYPDRLLIVGDALCMTNPSYGQGITLAAHTAITLKESLQAHHDRHPTGDLTGLAADFHHQAARRLRPAWRLASTADRREPATASTPTRLLTRLTSDPLLRLATHDPDLARAFLAVVNLTTPPAALLRPGILAATRRALLRGNA